MIKTAIISLLLYTIILLVYNKVRDYEPLFMLACWLTGLWINPNSCKSKKNYKQ